MAAMSFPSRVGCSVADFNIRGLSFYATLIWKKKNLVDKNLLTLFILLYNSHRTKVSRDIFQNRHLQETKWLPTA